MNYQNYEEYMRNVLGYSPYADRNYTYTDAQEDMYTYVDEMPVAERPTQDLTEFYPEIYKIIYPMVCKVCNMNSNREITKDLLEQMTDDIYRNVEPEEQQSVQRAEIQLKNGDVINPNAKEPEQPLRETRQNNFLLRDLIRILILRELGRFNRPPMRPPFPPSGGRPPMGPGMPPNRPGRPPMGSPPRPRYF
ncbi:MAG: hypothetical protein ACI4UX_06035 [Clostridia bacterium]